MSLWSWSCLIQRGLVTSHSQLEALLHSFLSDFLSLASLPVSKSFGLQSQFSTQENKTWSYHWASSSRDFDSLPCFLSSSIPFLWFFPRRKSVHTTMYDFLFLFKNFPSCLKNESMVQMLLFFFLPSCWTRNSERMRVNFLKARFQSVHLGSTQERLIVSFSFSFTSSCFCPPSTWSTRHLIASSTVTSNYSLSRTTNRPSLRW